jgi:hypothetical protein
MYLYATSVRPGQANPAKVMEWAVGLTQKINQISEVPSALWVTSMSPALGTLAFVSVVDDLALIEATEEKLAADPGYATLVEQGIGLISTDPIDQVLLQLVYGDPDAANIDARYATTVMASLKPGSAAAGTELGVDIAQRVKKITGRPTSFAVAVTGVYGQVSWMSLAENINQLQAAQEAIAGDTAFAKLLDSKAAAVYQPNATQTVSRKVI